ncbi:MAG: 30S ribosomal protein S17 [Chlamydiota bacterium]|nr:30S ribosomal protein S17 [Chlamydiota bacterium]
MSQDQPKRSSRKEKIGFVIGDKMNKTVVVRVDRRVPHPLYGKVIRVSKKFYVHDEKDQSQVGDKVKIFECRPLSKTKRWRLAEVLKK